MHVQALMCKLWRGRDQAQQPGSAGSAHTSVGHDRSAGGLHADEIQRHRALPLRQAAPQLVGRHLHGKGSISLGGNELQRGVWQRETLTGSTQMRSSGTGPCPSGRQHPSS